MLIITICKKKLGPCRLVMISILSDQCGGEDSGFHVFMNDVVQVRMIRIVEFALGIANGVLQKSD